MLSFPVIGGLICLCKPFLSHKLVIVNYYLGYENY